MSRVLRTLTVAAGLVGAMVAERAGAQGGPSPASSLATRTVVSFTFDDGLETQLTVRDALADAGVRGTFFVNTNKLGRQGTMDWSEVALLAADGHEIGGHTLDHVDLRPETDAERRRQICDDREALLARGYPARSFAYPFGRHDQTVRDAVAECGYRSARTTEVYDDAAAPLLPVQPLALPAWQAAGSTSLPEMQQAVLDAEAAGGGWVPFVFHDICDGCDPDYGVSPETFTALVEWVGERRVHGTVVRTVDDVLEGRLEEPSPEPEPEPGPEPEPEPEPEPPTPGPEPPADPGDPQPPGRPEPQPPLGQPRPLRPTTSRIAVARRALRVARDGLTVVARTANRNHAPVRIRTRLVTTVREPAGAKSAPRPMSVTRWRTVRLAARSDAGVRLRLKPAARRLLRDGRLRVRIAVQMEDRVPGSEGPARWSDVRSPMVTLLPAR